MSMIFKFRMVSDEVENFLRDYEVRYDMPLSDFHKFVRDSICYSPADMASIFVSDSEWEKLEEFTSVDMGLDGVDIDPDDDIAPPRPMSEVTLGQIIHEKFDRLIYVFDIFAERQFYIELLEAKFEDPTATYPTVIQSDGNPPEQFTEPVLDLDGLDELIITKE